MDCNKARRLFDDMMEGRLTEPVADELQRHLADCTDCRVLHQRAVRLQRLLALKRYEQPAPEYSQQFLTAFHTRLEAETRAHSGWWQRFLDSITAEPARMWQYGFAGAAGIALAVSMAVWNGGGSTQLGTEIVRDDQSTSLSSPSHVLTVVSDPASPSLPRRVAVTLTPPAEPSPSRRLVLVPTAAQDDLSAPSYVLDRILTTPASYEVASVHF